MSGRASTGRALAVYAPNWVGDTVMALPVLDALIADGRRPAVVCRPHLAPLLGLVDGLAAVHPADDDAERIAALAAYDEAVLLPNSFRSAWLARRAGVGRRWGYPAGFRRWLLAPSVRRPRSRRHQVEDYAPLLAAMGVPPPASWIPHLTLDPATVSRGRRLLGRSGIDPEGGPVVGLFAGAEFGPSKRWPRSHFETVARELRRRRPDVQITILAGPKEVWLAVRLHEETGRIHPVLGTDLDLADLAAVLAAHRALLTNDSGPMHLAAAVGVRCAALFGPTDPRRTAPAGDGHRVLTLDRWCSPCFRRRCPLVHHRCLRDLTPADAVTALGGLLDGA